VANRAKRSPKDLRNLRELIEEGRARTRVFLQKITVTAEAAAVPGSQRNPSRTLLRLKNLGVEARRQLAIPRADEVRLAAEHARAVAGAAGSLALIAELWSAQKKAVEELTAAYFGFLDRCDEIAWNIERSRCDAAVETAAAAIARARAEAERAAAEIARWRSRLALGWRPSVGALERRSNRIVKRLDAALTAAKRPVAVTLADEAMAFARLAPAGPPTSESISPRLDGARVLARLAEAAREDPLISRSISPRHPDPETVVRALAAQHAAVERLKQQLGEVSGLMQTTIQTARTLVAWLRHRPDDPPP
jgi:hypothetical protein